ncbi:ornithine cyclodeaminase [Podospora didyma]|uniref:Ornithine cyclodeaminase n=1 Tax=Podospora didyma TaxID=330526 RepID=A0AAE0NHH1_9PEZI|nr:ornithine cyclodeaminase [Podospora didyma]
MSAFSVLTDDQIRELLENLTVDELEEFRAELKAALHQYSTGTQAPDESSVNQPERTSIHSAETGATTLFMPSCSPAGHGVKVVTLSSAESHDTAAAETDGAPAVIRPTGAITLFSPQGQPVGILHASTLTAFRTALASMCLVQKRETVRTISVFGSGEQAYWHVRLTLMLRGSTIKQVHIINRRFSPYLKDFMRRLYAVPAATKIREGWGECTFGVLTPTYGEYHRLLENQLQSSDIIFCCTPSTKPLFDASILTGHDGRPKGRLIVAIGSYTPNMHELPVEILHQATKVHSHHHFFHRHALEGGVVVVDTLDGALKEAGELIEAELQPKQLVELGELVMLQNASMTKDPDTLASDISSNLSSTASLPTSELEKLQLGSFNGSGSAMSSVFSSSGEQRSSSRSRAESPRRKSGSGSSSPHRRHSFDRRASDDRHKKQKQKDDHLAQWLCAGNVIYKSVGLGLMDLTVGMHVIRFAREKGVGTHVEGF